MLRAAVNTVRWLVFDQRKLIREGFGDADFFCTELLLPVYSAKEVGKRPTFRRRTVVFLRGPEAFSRVYKASGKQIDSGSAYAFLKPYFGDESVFVMDGDRHIPAKQAIYRVIRENMELQNDDLLFFQYSVRENFRSGVYPVLPLIQYVSSAFVLRTIFGEQGTSLANATVMQAIAAAANAQGTFLLLPSLLRWTRRIGVGLSIRRQRVALRQFILDQIGGMDIGDDWHNLRDTERKMLRTQIVDNLMTLLIAGFETTATTISWLLYELARDEELQANLRTEVLDGLRNDPIAYLEDDQSLLARCVQETLRLHPSIPFVIREVVGDIDLGVHNAAVGEYLVLSIEELHSRSYSDESLMFRPDRFIAARRPPKIATFGGGAKICPGRAVAVQQVRILAGLLISSFLLKPTSKTGGRIARNRVSASPKGGMVLSLERIM